MDFKSEDGPLTAAIRNALALAAICALHPGPARAQGEPRLPAGMSVDQAVTLLRQNPELQSLVRQRLRQSGLTPVQVQDRLRAAGYPPNLLDAYLTPGEQGGGAPVAPLDRQTVEAIALLGVDAFPPEIVQQPESVAARLLSESGRADSLARVASGPGLRLFGLDVLRQNSTRFQPLAGPVDDSYPLGPGDQLVLILTGGVEVTHVLDVTAQGFIVIPRVGQIHVNSLTLGQLRDLLYTRLAQVYSGISRSPEARTHFDLAVAKIRVQAVRVVGEVARPGTYQVGATGGVLAAIYEAGGVSERGSFRAVEVRRGTRLLATVDLYEYLSRGVVLSDVRLQSGDVVFVPVHGPRVKVAGEVMRPAVYELKPNEALPDALRLAGGLTPYAATETATIDRLLPPDQRPEPGYVRTVLTASLKETWDSKAAPTALFAEDSITVFRVRGGRRSAVSIDGSVWQPGTYRLEPEMRLWDLIRGAGGLRPDTYGGRVQILRTLPDSTRRLLGLALDSTGTADSLDNPALQESDRVTVYAQTDFRPLRYITVYGAVRRPGTVAFADSMTLRDAILLAGGLRDDAYLGEAQVSRLRERQSDKGDSLAVVLRVPLDSSFVADSTGYVVRPPGGTAPSVVLHPYDNVFVRRQPGWELQRNVAIAGEVRFPGRYTLTSRDERIASVIARAGGLTDNAYARGFQLFRRSGSEARIAVDLPRVMRDPRHKDNLMLAAGDSLHVPAFIPTVEVDGAVNFPTSVTYTPDAGLDYYVNAAGGYAPQADKKRTFVRQPNGLVQRGARPEPGATVTVPRRDPSERRALLELAPFFTAAVQALAAAATLIIAITR